jgi:hypothetical protein
MLHHDLRLGHDIFRSVRRRAITVAFLAAAAAAAGCASRADPNLASGGGVEYPERPQSTTLNIQVVRDETVIRLTNTTARAFGPSRLWINRWYSRPIEKFDVGQTLELSLWDFRDQYGEPFEAGGFFAVRKPYRLSQAQLDTGDELLGLIVVARGEE